MTITTVYIDILFAVNLAINTSLILCTGYIIRQRGSSLRIMLSAVLGAVYSCFIFIGNIDALFSLGMRILVASLMMLTAFGTCRPFSLVKRVITFLATTLFLGMFMMCMLYFSPIGIRLGGVIKNGVFYFHIPTHYMLLCSVLIYGVIYALDNIFRKKSLRQYSRVTLEYLGKSVELKALIDTGNMLRDPISGKKVLIAEAGKLSGLFDFDMEEIFGRDNITEGLPQGFRLIPFSSIGNKNGLLAAFVPDMVKVDSINQNNIIAAVFCGKLTQSDDYNALLAPEIGAERMKVK